MIYVMKVCVFFLQLSLLLIWSSVKAQDKNTYQWKNRLVILATDNIDNANYKNQIHILKADPEGLEIRKLRVISLTQEKQITGISEHSSEEIHPSFAPYLSEQPSFEFYLIGLDGGIKYRSDSIVDNTTLFRLIDVMPMRRQELEKH